MINATTVVDAYFKAQVAPLVGSTITCPEFHEVWAQADKAGYFWNCDTAGDYTAAYGCFITNCVASAQREAEGLKSTSCNAT